MNGMKPVNLKLSSKDRSEILLVDIASAGFAFHLQATLEILQYMLFIVHECETAQPLKRERNGISMMYIMHRHEDV